jgi:RNA recognition motif-containing protein
VETEAKNTKRVPPVPIERKKIFIKNLGKDCVYEDVQEKVEMFGDVTDFLNPGRGFCFLTFSSSKAAKECVAALNKTEIAGKVVLMNIAREESESGLESNTIEGCTLFVHGVKQETDEEDIKAAFEEFGNVVDSFNPGKGFAFVTFSTPAEATAAAEALTGKEVCGSTISVNVSKPKVKPEADKNNGVKAGKNKKEKKEGIRLFVNNVSEDTSQDDLKAAFSAHGSVTDAYNPGKGFAFVDFATEDEANAAIEALNGKEVCGKEVECNIAKFKKKVQKGKARS